MILSIAGIAMRSLKLIEDQRQSGLAQLPLFNDNWRKECIKVFIDETSVHISLLELRVGSQIDEKIDVRLEARNLEMVLD